MKKKKKDKLLQWVEGSVDKQVTGCRGEYLNNATSLFILIFALKGLFDLIFPYHLRSNFTYQHEYRYLLISLNHFFLVQMCGKRF